MTRRSTALVVGRQADETGVALDGDESSNTIEAGLNGDPLDLAITSHLHSHGVVTSPPRGREQQRHPRSVWGEHGASRLLKHVIAVCVVAI